MARQNEEEDQLKIEVEIFLAFFSGQISRTNTKKSLQPKFEVEIYLALFSWLVSRQNTHTSYLSRAPRAAPV